MSAAIPREGLLTEIGFCELLAWLCRSGTSGTLRLCHGAKEKAIYLKEGKIVFAASKDPDERLGELLLNRGVITRAQFDQASKQISPGKRLGTILVEMGFLEARDLPRWVLEQVKAVLFSLFSWTEGSFRLEEGRLPSHEVITLKISTPEVFLTGARKVTRWSILKRDPSDAHFVFQLAPDAQETLRKEKLGDEDRALLELIQNTPMPLEELVKKSSLPVLTAYQILFAFRILGILVPTRRAEALPTASPPDLRPVTPSSPGMESEVGPEFSGTLQASDAGLTQRLSIPLPDLGPTVEAATPFRVEAEEEPPAPRPDPVVLDTGEATSPFAGSDGGGPSTQDPSPPVLELETPAADSSERQLLAPRSEDLDLEAIPLMGSGEPLDEGGSEAMSRAEIGVQTVVLRNPIAELTPAQAMNPEVPEVTMMNSEMRAAPPVESQDPEPAEEEAMVVPMEPTLETAPPEASEEMERPMEEGPSLPAGGDRGLGPGSGESVPILDRSGAPPSESREEEPKDPVLESKPIAEEGPNPLAAVGFAPSSRKKTEYHVLCVKGRDLKQKKVKEIEQLLSQWSQRGFHLAGVVQGQPSGLFESAPPSYFIFARD